MSLDTIELWHKRARPTLSAEGFNVQLGCHFEEIVEMIDALNFHTESSSTTQGKNTNFRNAVKHIADALKRGDLSASINDRKEFLDSVADQVVAGVGTAVCAGMRPSEAITRVDTSNWSKFVDGKPVFNEHGKIAKPAGFKPADLTGLY
jgi:predicted HAD superfamily Cof-like phosphohydrolase